MSSSDQVLIRKLQQRNADRTTATDGGMHSPQAFAPITQKDLRSVEETLGFELPEFVRSLYLNVGNGGFGPEYGIVGTKNGAKLDGCTLETCYENMLTLESETPVWRWPRRLLPLANFGCGMWSCVDCEYKRLPMLLWDPNNLDSELDAANAQLNWGNSFWDQGSTIKSWLHSWLTEKSPSDPQWPSDAWMKKRLGFTLPA